MPSISHREFIHSRFEIVWDLLVDTIEHPDKYLSNVKSVNISERHNEEFIREIIFENDEHLKEFIVQDKVHGAIICQLKDHLKYNGM
ncbi:unnamed protein product [Didymodactylos carnosus]|uniref:Uncharacterized protein n=1 Tax=Didymodactylos carnosus TaxID=1234261 RepID=A0A8S2GBK2_9BILA|nr:unnamed protein product [Didymodactylos carnosus]CAF4573524.1 unnamed protein product [Didymodactylos carnosus]